MTKLYIDEDEIISSVTPKLEIAIKYLNNALGEFNNIQLPREFEYERDLKQTKEYILSNLTSLKNKKLKLESVIESTKKIKTVQINNLIDIPVFEIKNRKKII